MPDFAIDAAPGLIKRERGQAAVTATDYIGTKWDQGDAVATDFLAVVNIEDIKVSAANETYSFALIGYNNLDRSDATTLGSSGVNAAATPLETLLAAAGDRIVIKGRTEKRGAPYRYVDLHLTVGGTAPSVNFNAFFSREI